MSRLQINVNDVTYSYRIFEAMDPRIPDVLRGDLFMAVCSLTRTKDAG